MKVLGFIFLIATVGQINAQDSELVDYLLQLQYVSEPVHQAMTTFFAEARAQLSVDLTALNDETVTEITNGLAAVIAIRDRTDEATAEATTEDNEVCITDATEGWAASLETVGSDIQLCADSHVDEIYEQTETFHLYVQEQNRLSFDAQNLVLNVFTDLNPLTQYSEITSTVEAKIDEIYSEFEGIIEPEVTRRLAEIANLRQLVPSEVHTCVDESIERFNNAALDVAAAVAAC